MGSSGILTGAMSDRLQYLTLATAMTVVALLSACATEQAPVVERLDEKTAVTITNSRTPIILSPDTPYDRSATRDYLRIGAIEVNRMGNLEYFLWIGISDFNHMTSGIQQPEEFESITLIVGSEESQFDVRGWTPDAIGASKPVYKKLFRNSADAYYQVTLEHIQRLAAADVLKLRTSGSEPRDFVPWYKQTTAKDDLAEFLETVLQ